MEKNFILKKVTGIKIQILNSFSVKWTFTKKVYGSHNPLLCKLCLTENLWIINFINDESMLNKKEELKTQSSIIYTYIYIYIHVYNCKSNITI